MLTPQPSLRSPSHRSPAPDADQQAASDLERPGVSESAGRGVRGPGTRGGREEVMGEREKAVAGGVGQEGVGGEPGPLSGNPWCHQRSNEVR